jgi:hypothetical protein
MYIIYMEHGLYIFSGTVLFLHIAYLAVFFGVVLLDIAYLRKLSTFVQLGVCLFLIWRFSPLRTMREITYLDRSIIFYCATFLFMNVTAVEAYKTFVIPFV